MRPVARAALAKRLDKLSPGRDWRLSMERLSRDQVAFLEAVNITLAMLPDPVARYAYTLTGDGVALVGQLFQSITSPANVDRIAPTDTPEVAQAKYRDWS